MIRCSLPNHPLTLVLHEHQSRARRCVSVAREKLTRDQCSAKPLICQTSAEDSMRNMSIAHRSLVSEDSGADSARLSIELRTSDGDRRKQDEGSLASDTGSCLSCTISSDEDPDKSSQYSFSVESQIAHEMAAEILTLLDQLENSVLTTFNELKSSLTAEDTDNVLQLTLEGFFFTHLWEDILSFYRYAVNNHDDEVVVFFINLIYKLLFSFHSVITMQTSYNNKLADIKLNVCSIF